ncbi:polymorphic toxin-type HINT domain-containing protein, partial [Kitasatospora sp. NPDC047058]|uniref:polymorphic toxin-type HINT domain-containing protein n=1 Tax=Kitasatospora sp. NPDC047058 TaxID=3155620 RepID=UPI0034068801
SAATHAQNAATAADTAAEHAGEAATSAAEATRQAEEARKAATSASEAVQTASTVYELARRTETEDLAARTAAAVEASRELRSADDENSAGIGSLLADWKAQDEEAAGLAAEAARPGADPKALAAKGRKVAFQTMKSGGPWSQEAAAAALSGTDAAVLDWVRTGRSKAAQDDMRQSVQEIAQDSPDEAVRTAATVALKGDAQQLQAFYTTGRHDAAITDNRVRAYQVIAIGGTSVKEAGEKALRDGSPKAVAAFLMVGQYTARQIDERVRATQLLAAGGPEVQAAAKSALAGTPDVVHEFLQTGQYMADRKDQLATTHAAQMSRLIAEASQTAAKAQQDAWEATEAAAVANEAAGEADNARNQARAAADQAGQYAAEAKTSAQDAETSATRAAQSATTARTASQAAARDAGDASASAARARASASQARSSADLARKAATRASASAVAAGKDAGQAQQAADEAWGFVAEKESQERQAQLKTEEAGIQAEAKQLADELAKELDARIREEIYRAEYERLRAGQPVCNAVTLAEVWKCTLPQPRKDPLIGGVPGLLMEWGSYFENLQDEAELVKKVVKAILGVDSAEECINQKSASSCAELAVGFFPAGKAVKLAQLAKKAKTVEEVAEAARLRRLADTVTTCLTQNSFPAGTPVLMADGSTRPIERVRVGDQVQATDPESGQTGSRRIDATIFTPDDRDFTELTVTSADGATGTITSTDRHPYWADNQHAWVDAADLTSGDILRTATSQTARITSTKHWKTLQPAYNLTVDTVHTYYVLAGGTPVLVHNSGPGCGSVWIRWNKVPHHFQHAADFGITAAESAASKEEFLKVLGEFIKNPGTTVIDGTYRKIPARHYVDLATGKHVSVDIESGELLGAWKSDVSTDQYRYLVEQGLL